MLSAERFLGAFLSAIWGIFISIPVVILMNDGSLDVQSGKMMLMICGFCLVVGYFFPELVMQLFKLAMDALKFW